MKIRTLSIALLATLNCFAQTNLVQYVDTKIGVIDNRGSACVIGAQLPFGSINPSPQTIKGGMGVITPSNRLWDSVNYT